MKCKYVLLDALCKCPKMINTSVDKGLRIMCEPAPHEHGGEWILEITVL